MLVSLTVLACALYLVPLVALVAVLRGALDDALDLASTIGVVFCGDVLGTLVLTHVLRVDAAAFVRTALILGVTLAVAVGRVRRGEPVLRQRGPLSRGDLVALGLGAAAAFALSLYASSITGYGIASGTCRSRRPARAADAVLQRLRAAKPLRYHLVGEPSPSPPVAVLRRHERVALALPRARSPVAVAGGSSPSCSRALRVAARRRGRGGARPTARGPDGLPRESPGTHGSLRGGLRLQQLLLELRPHCMVAGVVLLAFMANVARLARDRMAQRAPEWTRPAMLVLLMALLSIADEISSVLVGVTLALFWLGWPTLFGARRWRGAAVLVGLAVAALAANYFLGGTIGPGGPIQKVRWLAPRLPRFAAPGLPLGGDFEAWRVLFTDEGR